MLSFAFSAVAAAVIFFQALALIRCFYWLSVPPTTFHPFWPLACSSLSLSLLFPTSIHCILSLSCTFLYCYCYHYHYRTSHSH
ncbi:hypothetical protein CPB84DRAFT_1793509, partial [Gymnopilus junonius]